MESHSQKEAKFYPRTGKVVFVDEDKKVPEEEEKKVVKKDLSKK